MFLSSTSPSTLLPKQRNAFYQTEGHFNSFAVSVMKFSYYKNAKFYLQTDILEQSWSPNISYFHVEIQPHISKVIFLESLFETLIKPKWRNSKPNILKCGSVKSSIIPLSVEAKPTD